MVTIIRLFLFLSHTKMKTKYVICPGYVTSKNDGQRHYISAKQLMRLYGVNPLECVIYEPVHWWPIDQYNSFFESEYKDLPRLGVQYNGNYELPS